MNIWVIIISVLAGMTASMGLGGGFVLLVYLAAIAGTEQITAQGINLAFFVGIAAVPLFLHTKNKMIEWRSALYAVLSGAGASFAGVTAANHIDTDTLSMLFALLVGIVGIRELFHKKV